MSTHNHSSISWAFGNDAKPEVVSSNRYANGSNQNCGNVMTGRSSTRVHAAPGGNSSISLGFDPTPTAPAPVKKNVAPATATSTTNTTVHGARSSRTSSNNYASGANQNCGNVITDRSSTRVHAPPGGRSQICFGSYEAPKPAALKTTTSHNSATTTTVQKTGVSSNRYASGSNQNCGNVITDRSTTRIHAPPGGRSSFTLG